MMMPRRKLPGDQTETGLSPIEYEAIEQVVQAINAAVETERRLCALIQYDRKQTELRQVLKPEF